MQRFSHRKIDRIWEDARRLGVLSELYRRRCEDWGLLKCVRAYAKLHGEVRNTKLIRILEQIFAWLRARMSHLYRTALSTVRELCKVGKFGIGVWSSAGLRGRVLQFYLGLKNGAAPREFLVDLYYSPSR